MKTKSTNILNSFIIAPDLKINSERFSFAYFEFSKEEITRSNFQFPENLIIGMQAEACFEAILRHSQRYKLLASNLQIQGEKQTVGELDYIVQNLETKEVVHIELSCKFYLYDNTIHTSEESKWIGPNRKDGLYDKLEKIRSKQFPLITASETIQTLNRLDIELPTSQELCLKAFLFVPKETDLSNFSKNYKDCIVGSWIRQDDFIDTDGDALFAIPNKKEWLLPEESIQIWMTYDEAKSEINKHLQKQKSPLIYKKTEKKAERFFVVWW